MDKHTFLLLMTLTALLAMTSCTDELVPASAVTGTAFTPKGELVDAYLNLNVDGLQATAATKTQLDEVVDDTDEERAIYDLWIFQYDVSASSDEAGQPLISTPRYLTIDSENESSLDNLSVRLSDNDGDDCVVYVVANTDDSTWAKYTTTSGNYEGFRTVAELKANTIPTPKPQRMKYDYDAGLYEVYEDGDNFSIPMSGCSDKKTISEGTTVGVDVQRMFAKLRILVDLSNFNTDDYENATVYNVTVGNIPEYCTVGTLFSVDSAAASYENCGRWLTRAFSNNEKSDDESGEGSGDSNDTETVYPYVIYVPENIQGESETIDGDNTKALSVTVDINAVTKENQVTVGPYSFTAYPGSNKTGNDGNYNIKRNCVYDVTMSISGLVDTDDPLPSANCIICLSGETTAFYPYCREDAGGGYTFTDYLNSSYSTDDASKRIDHIEILWQSESTQTTGGGFIGDNSQTGSKLVWIDDAPTTGDNDTKSAAEYRRKIYVKIPDNETGNALVAAYNSDNEIIWSWHIWSRMKSDDPGNEANGVLYYTYDWDDSGIKYNEPRVAGYTVMNCNLGALQNLPDNSNYTEYKSAIPTYGNFYQWGRKDPFPAVKNVDNPADVYNGGAYNTDHVGKYYDNSNNNVVINIDSENEDDDTTDLFRYHTDNVYEEYEGINYSIQNPTAFMIWKGYNGSERDAWSYDAFYGFGQYNRTLWGSLNDNKASNYTKRYETTYYDSTAKCNLYITDTYGPEKTIFDPCPYGWRVSPPDLWLGFTNTGLNPDAELGTLDDQANFDPDKSSASGFTMYMVDWKQGSTSYFPVQGAIHADGKIHRINVCGNYTNAIQDYHHYVNVTHFHNEIGSFTIFCTECRYTSLGAPVRCVRFGSVSN